jgi:glycerol kinase
VEAIMLSAGTCIEWLRDDLAVIGSAVDSAEVAAACQDTGDVWFVPALLGLGTPVWDFGARGTVLGLTRGSGRPELVRAVLEGIAHRGADLLEAAESDSGLPAGSLRIDGGMSANPVFTQALADACGRTIEIAPVVEATTLGAAYLAGMAVGTWSGEEDVAAAWVPRAVVEPQVDEDQRATRRQRWLEARHRAEGTIPELSALDF